MDFISNFINTLVSGGIVPKNTTDIKETRSKWGRLQSTEDKNGKRSISYKLTIEHDFAYGYSKDHKTGIGVTYKSTNKDPNLTRADLSRIKTMMKARQAAEDVLIATRHQTIALRAQTIWNAALPHGDTPYTIRKKVPLSNARIIGDKLIIPIYHGTDLVSWQMIRADGTKKFPFGGKKQGCWCIIGQIDPTAPFYICEGWATGATIHQATHSPVVVSFDAGNMPIVAKSLRKLYPATPIIIAADHDASGTGQKAAETCRKSISNCTIIMPHLPPNTKSVDFNDDPSTLVHNKDGQHPPAGVLSPTATSVQPGGGDWMSQLTTDSKGNEVTHSLKNAILYISHHHDFKGVFVFDHFKQSIVIKRCPPYQNDNNFSVREITEHDFIMTAATLEDYKLMITVDKTKMAIETSAKEHSENSAKDYFSTLVWDKTPRLETFLRDYFNCIEDQDYLSWVGTKWMTAAIKRIFEPGCKFDHILILESQKQGLYKSAALKALVTFNGETYHTDSVSALTCDSAYTPLQMIGVMIIELAELTGFSKKEDAVIKNWITQTEDRVKLPFDRSVTKFKRQFVFAATTNETEYLKDPTGNRRYWPVTINDIIDVEKIKSDAPQLWAESYHNYISGLYIGPTPEESKIADKERRKKIIHDILTDDVLAIIEENGLDQFRIENIIKKMPFDILTDKNDVIAKRVKKILLMNSYINEAMWNRDIQKTQRLWRKADA